MGELLHLVASEASLLAAWQDVRESDLDDGRLSPQVLSYEKGVLTKLAALSTALRSSTWEPHPVYAREIPKPSGEARLLAIPHVEDRVVERSVLDVLDELIDPILLPWSFAYRKGLGVKDALHALATARDDGNSWVVRADIDDCFEAIPRWPLLTRLREILPDGELCLLIQQLVNRPGVGPAARRIRSGKGLHQGSSLSPVLTNLYLDDFDRTLLRAGHRVLRYADDFAIPVTSHAEGERVLGHVSEVLRGLDLRLNEDKSCVVPFDEGVEFLGTVTSSRSGTRGEELSEPLEGTVYVTEPGSLLRSRGDRLRVTKGDSTLLSVSLNRVRQIVCHGRVGVSTPLLHRALRHEVDLVLLDHDGDEFLGRLVGPYGTDVELRHAQHRLADRDNDRLSLAKSFVTGKVANMRTALLRAARSNHVASVEPAVARMLTARRAASEASSIPELMGHEGTATRDYFTALSGLLGSSWEFTHRQRRPPPDPVNAMLSFGYTLLTREGVTALEIASLDPAVSFLHEMRRGRPSLALDLIEEFRPVIVDPVVTQLVTSGKLSPADFTIDEDRDSGCRMSRDALKVFLSAYEKRMLTLAHHPHAGRRTSYRTAMAVQARLIAAVIRGREAAYTPLAWR